MIAARTTYGCAWSTKKSRVEIMLGSPWVWVRSHINARHAEPLLPTNSCEVSEHTLQLRRAVFATPHHQPVGAVRKQAMRSHILML